jgi:hypothetical protein
MAIQTHGAGTYFSCEDSARSTLRDISIYVTQVDYNRTNDTHDNTTFGATAHGYQTGLTDGTISISGFWNKTASTGASTVLDSLLGSGDTLGYEYGPEGNTNGEVKYSGECVLQDLSYSSPVADMVTFSATLQLAGPVTKGTFSA